MKKKVLFMIAGCIALGLTGCGAGGEDDNGTQIESGSVTEAVQTSEEEEVTSEEQSESVAEEDNTETAEGTVISNYEDGVEEILTENVAQTETITQDQALAAIKKYCYTNDPDLESKEGSDEYTIGWGVTTNEAGEIVVLYRSYTAAEIRYYINPTTGETYVTELVPGIIDEEQRTDESLNVRDYLE